MNVTEKKVKFIEETSAEDDCLDNPYCTARNMRIEEDCWPGSIDIIDEPEPKDKFSPPKSEVRLPDDENPQSSDQEKPVR